MIGVRFVGWETSIDHDDDTSVVAMIIPGAPAENAGVQVGDEILSINERVILQPVDSLRALEGRQAGDVVRLEIKRGDEFLFVDVRLRTAIRGNEILSGDGNENMKPIRMPAGILGQEAPEWTVSEWTGLPEGQTELTLAELKGKTVFLFCFQSTCEASREAMRMVRELKKNYEADESVEFVAVQTAFENYLANTMTMAKRLLSGRRLDIPLGHDGYENRESQTAKSYDLSHTPWMVIIGPDGRVKFNGYNLDQSQAIDIIERTKKANSR